MDDLNEFNLRLLNSYLHEMRSQGILSLFFILENVSR